MIGSDWWSKFNIVTKKIIMRQELKAIQQYHLYLSFSFRYISIFILPWAVYGSLLYTPLGSHFHPRVCSQFCQFLHQAFSCNIRHHNGNLDLRQTEQACYIFLVSHLHTLILKMIQGNVLTGNHKSGALLCLYHGQQICRVLSLHQSS